MIILAFRSKHDSFIEIFDMRQGYIQIDLTDRLARV